MDDMRDFPTFTKELQTLEDWNREAEEFYDKRNRYPKPNGLACPECGRELVDLDNRILSSYPPKREIGCPHCSYQGYRVA